MKKSTLFYFACAVHLERQVISLEYDKKAKGYRNPVRVYGRRNAGKLELSPGKTLEPYLAVPFETLLTELRNDPGQFSVVKADVNGSHFVPWVRQPKRKATDHNQGGVKRKRA